MNMKLSNQGLSSKEEFKQFIESIGFKREGLFYYYKSYRIDLYNYYHFYNGSEWIFNIPLNDIRPFDMYFKKELRSIKLKELLRCV